MKRLFKKQMNRRYNKKRVTLLVFLIISGLLLGGFLIWNKVAPELANQCRGGLESPIYKEAISLANERLLTTDDQVIALKIQENKGYKSDVNCLYPLINYYMKQKEADKVKTLFGLYGLAYGEDRNAEKMYKDYDVKTYEDVKKQVDLFIKNEGSVDAVYY